MGEVDPAFIQALEHRPKSELIQADGIPLIDLSPLNSPDFDPDALERLVSKIGEACEKWGFFQVINHGVPSQALEKIRLASRKFFWLPKEEKKKVSRDEVNPYGYYDTEHTKNVRDWKEVFDFTVLDPIYMPFSGEPDDTELKKLTSTWPDNPPELR